MRNWVKSLIWIVFLYFMVFAYEVGIYLFLGGDPVEIVGDKVKMFDFEPTFLVFAGVTAGIVALLAGLADLKYDWIGSVGRILKTKLDLKVECIEGDDRYQQWDPDKSHPLWLLHRISVHNESKDRQIKKVRVELHDFQGAETWVRGLPFGLHIKDRNNSPKCFDPEIDLDADQIAFFDLVSLAKREMNEGCLLAPARSWPANHHIPLSINKYVLKIKIFAEGKLYREKQYQLIQGNPNRNVYYRFIES